MKRSAMRNILHVLVGRFAHSRWTETTLLSPHHLVFTVRDAPGREREIQHAMTLQWTPVSRTRFSQLPCFEEWHRNEYEQARPYAPNAEAHGRRSRAVQPLVGSLNQEEE